MHQFHPEPLTKFTSSSRSTKFKDILSWNISQILQRPPNQHKNSHKLFGEMGHPILSLMASQWKLGQEHDQNFLMERKPL